MNLSGRKNIYSRDNIALLCRLATLKNANLRRLGSSIILTTLTEGLCDSFDKKQVMVYDRMFSQVIDFCRRMPAGKNLDRTLNDFGIKNEGAMLRRKKRISRFKSFPLQGREKIKKIIILSRVTIGSDVAVTSVIIEKLKRVFPQAEIVFIGSVKINELFGGDQRIKLLRLDYPRRGGVMERLNMWLGVLTAVKEETRGLAADGYFIVDPDSRLTQLGLLPVLKNDKHYYFFESRSYTSAALQRLSRLTAAWADSVFGETKDALFPYVRLSRSDKETSGRILGQLRRNKGAGTIVSINFGFGGNANKRVSPAFEKELLQRLLNGRAKVILDKGSAEEAGGINKLIAAIKRSGKKVVELKERDLKKAEDIKCDLLVWEGRVGVFSAFIAESSAYIGYDSAFQHIASALGVPATVIFSGAPCSAFFKRWQTYGRGCVNTVKVSGSDKESHKKLLAKVLDAHKKCME
ncbi:MAG: hypothetical protein NTV07_07375 [Candidatus Omnitrophica bacterium]|nr:hypothetical protein [Candidatus Omnitrophota bacterium]